MNYSEIKRALSQPKKVVITSHRSPDGDAVGSSLALYHALIKGKHEVSVVLPDPAPEFLHWMFGHDHIITFENDSNSALDLIQDADIIFSLDYNNMSRLGEMGKAVGQAKALKILIDHHIDPSNEFDELLSDVSASSTAELVYGFLLKIQMGSVINVAIAECLYTGLMTDTGSFKYPSTSAETHRIVANLMEIGLVPERVHSAVFDTNSFDRLQLIGYALYKKLNFDAETGISVIDLSLQEKNRFKYQRGDTEGLVNYGLSVKGAKMAVFLSEELNFTKLSFRSKGNVDVNFLARQHFNGGGHKNAAGGRLDMDIQRALKHLQHVLQSNPI